jgi:hypothetical protein
MQSEVDGCDDFLFAGLEKGELDVGKGDIDSFVLERTVPETVEVAF